MTATGVAPEPTTLGARAAARAPERVAAVGADGAGVAWSGVAAEARHGALGLVALGLRPGDRVAVAVGPPDRWLAAALAVIGAGGVVVPLPGALAAAAAVARTARVHWAVTDGAALGARLAPEVTILAEGEGRGDHRWTDVVATGAAAPGDG
ncbi:MAG: AMP-binding protein, partial [Acidimicrobiales bacterium]